MLLQVHLFSFTQKLLHTPPFLPPPQPRTIPRQALPHTRLMNALFVLHPCKTLGVQHRASLPVPCQRELACGKARIYQIRPYFATPTTPKLHKPYLPSRLRDRLHRTFPILQTPPLTIPQSQCRKTRFYISTSLT